MTGTSSISTSHDRRGTLWLLGGGGHAAVVAETARAAGWIVDGFFDDADDPAQGTIADLGIRHLGPIDAAAGMIVDAGRNTFVHAATGDNDRRRQWHEMFEPDRIASVVHPTATVSPSAKLSFGGVYIGARAVINARATIERGVIINTGAIIEHDCHVESFTHIAPAAVLAGGAHIGEHCFIGCRATVINGVRIGGRATLGAGAVAVNDLPADVTAVGVPARVTLQPGGARRATV